MGIIQRQGIKGSIVNFAGAFIGAISILFIYPLNDEIYGYAQWMYSTAYLLVPFASLGVVSLIVRYYPAFKKSPGKNDSGFMSLIFTFLAGAFTFFLICWFLFRRTILKGLDYIGLDASLVRENEPYLIALTAAVTLVTALNSFSQNKKRIVVPTIIHQLGYKIFLPLLVLGYIYFQWRQGTFATGLILFFIGAIIVLVVYLFWIDGLHFGRVKMLNTRVRFREMGSYALFGALNLLSVSLAFRIDSVMIPFLLDLTSNGVYNKTLFIANVLIMPTRSIYQISAPIISKAWDEKDMDEIRMIYRKTSTNLFLVGCFLFSLFWWTLDDIIGISSNPDAFEGARMIFLFLALGKLFDMVTGNSSSIIIYSKYYRVHLVFLGILGISNVILNYILISKFGLTGAALATGISLFLFCFLKYLFLQIKCKIQPFSHDTLKTLALLLVAFGASLLLPDTGNDYLNIVYKTALVSLFFISGTIYWNISEDINKLVRSMLRKIKNV